LSVFLVCPAIVERLRDMAESEDAWSLVVSSYGNQQASAPSAPTAGS
jgi:hypothetical protein